MLGPRNSPSFLFSSQPGAIPDESSQDGLPFPGPESNILLFNLLPGVTQGYFWPSPDQIDWLISLLISSGESEQDSGAHILAITFINTLCHHIPDVVTEFIEHGLVPAICPLFPLSGILDLLARAVSSSRRAADEAIGLIPDILSLLQGSPCPLFESLIGLAGSFGVWGDCEATDGIVDILLTVATNAELSEKVLEAVELHIRFSERKCTEFIDSDGLAIVLSLVSRPVNQPAAFRLLGALLLHLATPPEVVAVCLEQLLTSVESAQSPGTVTAIVKAIAAGCWRGPEYVDACLPMLPSVLARLEGLWAFQMKTWIIDSLCNLFMAGSYESALTFEASGFFLALGAFADQMTAPAAAKVLETLSFIREVAAKSGNAGWLEFLHSGEILNLLEILAPDSEVAAALLRAVSEECE
jgi:hypothetical protein